MTTSLQASNQASNQVARPMTEVESQVASLEVSTKRLFDSIDRLSIKIQSSLAQEEPHEVADQMVGNQHRLCVLAEQILSQECSIIAATEKIESLIVRCQL